MALALTGCATRLVNLRTGHSAWCIGARDECVRALKSGGYQETLETFPQ